MGDNKPKQIQVILCEPGKQAQVTTIDNTLQALQQAVQGTIQAVYPFDDPVAILCNDEGKLNGMELNRALRDGDGNVYDILAGPFLIVGLGDEDFASLSQAYLEKYRRLFEYPEMFFHAVQIDTTVL